MYTGKAEHKRLSEDRIMRRLEGESEYIKEYFVSEYCHEYTTLADYVYKIINFSKFAGKPLDEVEVSDVYAYMKHMSDKSVQYQIAIYSALKSFYTFMHRTNRVSRNIMLDVERPNHKKSNAPNHKRVDKLVTADEIRLMLNDANNQRCSDSEKEEFYGYRDTAIITMLTTIGSRVTPVTEIDVDDIDWDGGCISVIEKGGNEIKLYLSDKCEEKLREWLKFREGFKTKHQSEALFINTRGKRMTPAGIAIMLKERARRNGIDDSHVSPHAFRAAFGVYIQEKHGDIYYTQQCMGHKSVQTTTHYVRSMRDDIRRAGVNDADGMIE